MVDRFISRSRRPVFGRLISGKTNSQVQCKCLRIPNGGNAESFHVFQKRQLTDLKQKSSKIKEIPRDMKIDFHQVFVIIDRIDIRGEIFQLLLVLAFFLKRAGSWSMS